jgi:MFS family permease
LFVPSIIEGLGFEAAKAQAMSTPPFVFTCILTFIVGYYSDRLKSRGPFICAVALLGIIGYSILLSTSSPAVGYVGAFFAGTVFCNIAMTITWAGSNTAGDLKRAVVLAMVLSIGNLGG